MDVTQMSDLQRAVLAYLADQFPVGTSHPADRAADELREHAGIDPDYWR